MLGGPDMPFLAGPSVDDVADQIERLAIDMVEEVDQQIGVASARAEMDVADPNRAIAAPLADDALRHMRVGGEGIGKARRDRDRKRVGKGKGVSVRVDLGGRSVIKKKRSTKQDK